jgi:hypothetical protein
MSVKRELFYTNTTIFLLILVICSATFLFASDRSGQETSVNTDLNYAQVLLVKAVQSSSMLWRFDVTVRHNDEGWEHYADAWQIIDPESGKVIAERVLAHPHENEQPFTRSLGNIEIPRDLKSVAVRAKCNVHGFGGREVLVDLTNEKGDDFEVRHTE